MGQSIKQNTKSFIYCLFRVNKILKTNVQIQNANKK